MTRPAFVNIALLFWVGCFLVLAHAAHDRATITSAGTREIPLPNGDAVRLSSFGHYTSVADLYWLKLVQYIGTFGEDAKQWPQIEPLADLVVTLDPHFGYAYEATGVVLSSLGRFESSNAILERGMDLVPARWQLPFFAGFNYWSALGNLEKGAELTLRASKISGSPRYLPELAARIFSSAGTLDDGIAALELAIQSTSRSHLRAELEHRQKQLEIEFAIRRLELAVAEYRTKRGAPPASLADLEDAEAQRIAASPLAAAIKIDPNTGAVFSPLLPRRLLVYRPARVPDALAAP